MLPPSVSPGTIPGSQARPHEPPAAVDELAEEASLVERLRRGEEEAFAHLVRRDSGRLFAVAVRILGHPEDARDAVQEALLSAFRSIGSFRAGARLSTWLHRIVVNAALMRLRSARRREEEGLEDLLPSYDETGHRRHHGGPWRAEPEAEHLRSELRRRVRRAIDTLPDRYRVVLVLRDVEELDTEETAKLLGLTVNAVRIRLHRARQALRTLLEPMMREGGSGSIADP